MTTWVALLRGINLGSRKRISMADLRALFETLGLEAIRAYVVSGNVVFESPRRADRKSTRLNSSHEVPSRMPSSA